jgi:uncharacterized integral membrane protein
MRLVRTLLGGMMLLATVTTGALFSLQNATPISLDLLVIQLSPRPASVWLLGMLAIGALLGLLASSVLALQQRALLARQRREVSRLQIEVDQLRRAGVTNGD